MMSSMTRIRTVRRRSSRLSTWLYSDGPLVPSCVRQRVDGQGVPALAVQEGERGVDDDLAAESGAAGPGLRPPDRPADDSGSAGMAIALRLREPGLSTDVVRASPERRTLVCRRHEHVGSFPADRAPWREEPAMNWSIPCRAVAASASRSLHLRRRGAERSREERRHPHHRRRYRADHRLQRRDAVGGRHPQHRQRAGHMLGDIGDGIGPYRRRRQRHPRHHGVRLQRVGVLQER